MSTQELRSYRLSSLEDPTDEMLHAIMEQVAEVARRSSANAEAIHQQRMDQLRQRVESRRNQSTN